MINQMGKEHSLGLMERGMLENGKKGKKMGKEHSLSLMVENWLVNSEKILPGTSLITTKTAISR